MGGICPLCPPISYAPASIYRVIYCKVVSSQILVCNGYQRGINNLHPYISICIIFVHGEVSLLSQDPNKNKWDRFSSVFQFFGFWPKNSTNKNKTDLVLFFIFLVRVWRYARTLYRIQKCRCQRQIVSNTLFFTILSSKSLLVFFGCCFRVFWNFSFISELNIGSI